MRGLKDVESPVVLQGDREALKEGEDADLGQGEGGAQKEGAGGGGGGGGGRRGGIGFDSGTGAVVGDPLAVEKLEGKHLHKDELLCVCGGGKGQKGRKNGVESTQRYLPRKVIITVEICSLTTTKMR